MAHHRDVLVILHGNLTYLRVSTISRYLPSLWRRYARLFPLTEPLRPVNYLHQGHEDQWTRIALRYLFAYLEGIDETTRKRAYLQDFLHNAWITDGPRRGRKVFLALGRILLPQNFGCHREIWLNLEMFVVNHSHEIHGNDWIEYIKALDEVDASERSDLKDVIWCFTSRKPISLQQLRTPRLTNSLGPRPLHLLSRLIQQRDRNILHRHCITCYNYNIARVGRTSDGRRREPYLQWTDYVDGEAGLIDQCELCFRLYGSPHTRHRRALPHAHRTHLLHHAAHSDNYEIEHTPRVFGDNHRDIPRYIQPAFHDGRHDRLYPRHRRVVEVVG